MKTYGRYGPANRRLGQLVYWLNRPIYDALYALNRFYRPESGFARRSGEAMQAKLATGAPVYLLGLGPGGHNSGAALVRVSNQAGIEILCNNEEERFTGIKHCADFPESSLADLRDRLDDYGVKILGLARMLVDLALHGVHGLRSAPCGRTCAAQPCIAAPECGVAVQLPARPGRDERAGETGAQPRAAEAVADYRYAPSRHARVFLVRLLAIQ
ncbi:MAG: hypothetical protein ABI612_24320 [Betaproteobacteria bacterium]